LETLLGIRQFGLELGQRAVPQRGGALQIVFALRALEVLTRYLERSAQVADPEALAYRLAQQEIHQWSPASFSPELDDLSADSNPGREFLMWLWFSSEERGGLTQVPDVGEIAFMLEGPLTFALEGKGAHETILKKGEPTLSAEAQTALRAGKKLKKAKLHFARGEEIWEFTLDADDFVFRSLKLPPTESYDRIGRFQERMVLLDTFRSIFFHLFEQFCKERSDASRWEETKKTMREWVSNRPTSV